MKKIFLPFFILFFVADIMAQQNVLQKINSPYLHSRDYLRTVSAVNDLNNTIFRKYIGMDYLNMIDRFSDKSAYFRTRYPLSEPNEIGLLNVSWLSFSRARPRATIEEFSKSNFDALTLEEDWDSRVIKFVKNNMVHGSYMYNKNTLDVYFLVVSMTKPEMIRGSVKINLTNDQLKEAFLNDFIQKIKFEPDETQLPPGNPGGTRPPRR